MIDFVGVAPCVLVVEGDDARRASLAARLRAEGFTVVTAASGDEALAIVATRAPDAIVSEAKGPGVDGAMLVERARAACPDVVVVLVSASPDTETAARAMQAGAEDYLVEPLDVTELKVILGRALERRRLRREAAELHARAREQVQFGKLIGTSEPMQAVYRTIERVAPSRATVLVTGESGTGKELVAQAIHERSPRARGAFIKLHCAALAESLLESELFGHEKGAFTGAVARREGHFKNADGGTLFLDEIGEISPAIQVKLLRFLQEREFERVGGSETIKVDVRVIAATNRDLRRAVEQGRFREDLYYRLNVVNVEVPPLRTRADDVLPLARHFRERFARDNGKTIEGFDTSAIARIESYPWPGNVRELENVIERAVVLCDTRRVTADHLPVLPPAGANLLRIPGSTLRDLERRAILDTLEAVGGSTSRAAKLLGISVRKIQYRLLEYGVSMKRVASSSEPVANA